MRTHNTIKTTLSSYFASDRNVVWNIVRHPFSVESEALIIISDAGVLRPFLVILHDVAADEKLDDGVETALETHEESDTDEDASDQLHSVRQHSSSN